MAGRKKNQNVTIEDIKRLGPKKFIMILITAVIVYFFGGNVITDQSDDEFIVGVVVRVIDGDTAVVKVEGGERRVRFLGVDTPETVHPNKPVQFYGKEASNFTKDSLTGKAVWLEYDASPTDRYNRHLVYIWTSRPSAINESSMRESMFNAKLLLGGYAKVMIIKPNGKYADLFRKFESEAKTAKIGMWSK
jgi:micrococcal nuclease